MSSTYLQVFRYFQRKIAESGLVIDEDLELMNTTWNTEEATTNKINKRLIILGTVIFGLFCAFQREKPEAVIVAGAVIALPVVSTFALSVYSTRKKNNLKNNLENLINAFKALSRTHTEVYDFLKCFEKSIGGAIKQPFNMISDDSVIEFAKTVLGFQYSFIEGMKIIICELNVELKNFLLDMEIFDKATSIELSYLTIKDSIYNASFIEGQVILLRSHLLISIYLMCTTNENPHILLKVMAKSIPQLVKNINFEVARMKSELEAIRFPRIVPALNLSGIDKIASQKSVAILPRMRRNLTKMNDNACCTLFKLQSLLVTLDNIHTEQQMIMLEQAVSNVAQELFQCYVTAADFAKILEILNGNPARLQKSQEICQKNLIEEAITITNSGEEVIDELAGESVDYQEFASNIDDTDDEDDTLSTERRAISIYRKAIKQEEQSGLLMELQQSDEFKKRQIKFKTVLTSTPAGTLPTSSVSNSSLVQQDSASITTDKTEISQKDSASITTDETEISQKDSASITTDKTEISQKSASSTNFDSILHSSSDTSGSSYQTISKEDLLQEDQENQTVVHIPPPPPPPLPQSLTPAVGESNLQTSLEVALAKRGKSQVDTYE